MTTTPPPNTEAVETAMRYARTNHRIHSVLCEDADRIWLHVPEECKSVGAALCYGTARILAAEVERLRVELAAAQAEAARLRELIGLASTSFSMLEAYLGPQWFEAVSNMELVGPDKIHSAALAKEGQR